jgi:hypothetical protein
MSHRKLCSYIIAGCVVLTAGLILLGCNSGNNANSETSMFTEEAKKGNAQLWAENCGRCHNLRTPTSYGDVQWEVAMHHMRVRADLTAIEHREILEFLEASN